MKSISLAHATKLTSPNPLTLICTEKPDGSTNLAAVSWWTYLSFHPGMIAYAMSEASYSGELVRLTKKGILTVPGAEIAEAVMGCGSTSGRNVNKAEQFHIELTDVPDSSIRIPVHSCVAIEYTMKEYHKVGDHYLYICQVEQVYAQEEEQPLFAWSGYKELHPVRKA